MTVFHAQLSSSHLRALPVGLAFAVRLRRVHAEIQGLVGIILLLCSELSDVPSMKPREQDKCKYDGNPGFSVSPRDAIAVVNEILTLLQEQREA